MIYYHATFNAYLDSIKKLGLVAGINKNWEISKKKVIYLIDGLEEAIEFCESCYEVSEKIHDSGIVVLGIEEEDLDLKYLKPDENWKKEYDWKASCYEYYLSIPFDKIKPIMSFDTV